MKKEWQKVQGRKNKILNLKDCYISYNDDMPETKDLGGETAICKVIRGRQEYFVLVGDHRAELEKYDSFIGCKKFYDSMTEKHYENNFTVDDALNAVLKESFEQAYNLND